MRSKYGIGYWTLKSLKVSYCYFYKIDSIFVLRDKPSLKVFALQTSL